MNKTTFTKEDLEEALARKQFEVYYQPIIDKGEERIISGEALIRWNHPQLGFLHPKSFIGKAEETGMIFELGEFVLREACLQSKTWKESGHPFYKVSVNLSLMQLTDKQFPKKVFAILDEVGMHPPDLELEITETMAMVEPEVTKSVLSELKSAGVRIMLDDFGAGYSSLSHLRHFPVDGLKIDRQFIRQALHSVRDSKLIQSIIHMARSLELHIVAEGVETEEQLALLTSMDCKTVQGFYFTHALSSREYAEWCHFYTSHPELRM